MSITLETALIGAALALINCHYDEACNSLTGYDGCERRVFADHQTYEGASYDEATACAMIPVILYEQKFDPMATNQASRRGFFRVQFSAAGARITIDLESAANAA